METPDEINPNPLLNRPKPKTTRFYVITFFACFVILITLFVVKQYIGDLRPALVPTQQKFEQKPTSKTVQNPNLEQVSSEIPPLTLPNGFKIGVFAKNLGDARDLEFSPGGTLIVSVPGQGKVKALPDKNRDGIVDEVKDILSNLTMPHGLAFYNNKLFVAEERRVVRYVFNEQTLTAAAEKVLFDLPRGGNHNRRTLTFDNRGNLFVSIGSTCDVCFENHPWSANVIVSDQDGTSPRVFAKGLRNAPFLVIGQATNRVWSTGMGRDFLGDNLPPDEINILEQDVDYGWPICYGNRTHDTKFDKNTYIIDPCQNTVPPVFEIAAHSAPLGLAFVNSTQFPKEWQGDLLVAYHGSWNRSTPIGYKVVRLNVEGEKITAEENFVSGFLKGTEAVGRPVDVIFDKNGSLYISDDKAGLVYKVVKTS